MSILHRYNKKAVEEMAADQSVADVVVPDDHEEMALDAAAREAEVSKIEGEYKSIDDGVRDAVTLEELADVLDLEAEPANRREVAMTAHIVGEIADRQGVQYSDIIPEPEDKTDVAMEAHIGKKISTETMREFASKLLKNAAEAAKKMFEYVINFMKKLMTETGRAKMSLDSAASKLEKSGNTALEKMINYGTGASILRVDGGPAVGELTKRLSDVNDTAVVVYKKWPTLITNRLEATLKAYKKHFDGGMSDEEITSLYNTITEEHLAAVKNEVPGWTEFAYIGHDAYKGPVLYGDKQCVIDLAGISVHNVDEATADSKEDDPKTMLSPVLSKSDLKTAIKSCHAFLEMIEAYNKETIQKLSKELQKTEIAASGLADNKEYTKPIQKIVSTFASSATKVYPGFSSYLINICHAVAHVTNKCAAAYSAQSTGNATTEATA